LPASHRVVVAWIMMFERKVRKMIEAIGSLKHFVIEHMLPITEKTNQQMQRPKTKLTAPLVQNSSKIAPYLLIRTLPLLPAQ
jgi:hypothetical protein